MNMKDPKEPSTEVTLASDTELMELPPPAEDVVVLARNPQEMVAAQDQLMTWANRKIEIELAGLQEASLNLDQAKKLKIRTEGWKNQVASRRKRVTFYEKIREAIKEGYYIVPNFPFQVIGVRTDRKKPPVTEHFSLRSVPQIKSNLVPPGGGRYVSPDPYITTREINVKDPKTNEYKSVTKYRAYDFNDFDFPFKMVKPKVLSDLNRAMRLQIFDEIGVLPAIQQRGPDPMVVGTIKRREGYTEHQVTFLISWWIDTRTL